MINYYDNKSKIVKKMVTEGIEPSTVALLAQRSNQLSYATYLTYKNDYMLNKAIWEIY